MNHSELMRLKNLGQTLRLLVLTATVTGCSNLATETAYNTVGRAAVGLTEDGYLVAFEKYKLKHCTTPAACYERNYVAPTSNEMGFVDITNGVKTMLVTHIVEYTRYPSETAVQSPDQGLRPRVPFKTLYNAYQAHQGYPKFTKRNQEFFEEGQNALYALRKNIAARLRDGVDKARPYTHVILIGMGWNNDQQESVGRYSRMLSELRKEAEGEYRPLVVALSWPSVWFSNADFWLTRLVGHIGSYPVKANDADELGYTLAADLMHRVIGGAISDCTRCDQFDDGYMPEYVVLGHSFGARLLARALFSRNKLNSLKRAAPEAALPDIFIGLQGAFSANRFIAGSGKERSPFANFGQLPTAIVLTSTEADNANRAARFVTFAPHVGGEFGLKEAAKSKEVFCRTVASCPLGSGQGSCHLHDVPADAPHKPVRADNRVCAFKAGVNTSTCLDAAYAEGDEKRVAIVDSGCITVKYDKEAENEAVLQQNASLAIGETAGATVNENPYVSAHNDVLDDETARLIWRLLGRSRR